MAFGATPAPSSIPGASTENLVLGNPRAERGGPALHDGLPLASEAKHVEESGLHLRLSRRGQRRDERPQVGAIHDADPLYRQHAGAGQTVSFGEVNFPRQPLACVDSGMTGTWDNDGSTSSRPSTSTGRFLSGALKRNQRISPRAIKGTPARRHRRSVPEGLPQSTGSKP